MKLKNKNKYIEKRKENKGFIQICVKKYFKAKENSIPQLA